MVDGVGKLWTLDPSKNLLTRYLAIEQQFIVISVITPLAGSLPLNDIIPLEVRARTSDIITSYGELILGRLFSYF